MMPPRTTPALRSYRCDLEQEAARPKTFPYAEGNEIGTTSHGSRSIPILIGRNPLIFRDTVSAMLVLRLLCGLQDSRVAMT
jgi:hypothetical protein